jgi:hypothetical protein
MSLGNVIQLGIPDPSTLTSTQVLGNAFLKRLHDLENRKMDLFMRGAFFNPLMMIQIQKIDRKLDKYYRWYAQAWMAGKV